MLGSGVLASSRLVHALALASMLACSAQAPEPGKPTAKSDTGKRDAGKADADKAEAGKREVTSAEQVKPKRDVEQRVRAKAKTSRETEGKFQILLDAGREASKAKDYPLAMSKLHTALAIRPGHGGALGELGWAAFNAGKLDEAEGYTRAALLDAADNNRRGALLYNLGRIDEARGDSATAISQYESSLAVRPNPTVEQRLAQLRAATPTAVVAPTRVAGAEALCSAQAQAQAIADSVECTCEVVDATSGNGQGWLEAAQLVTSCQGDWSIEMHDLAVRDADGWRNVGTFMTGYGGGTDHAEGSARLELVELDPSVGLEVRITTQFEDWASDGYDETIDGRVYAVSEQATTIVCGADAGGWCVTLPTSLRSGTHAFAENEVDAITSEFEATLSFDGAGSVSFTTTHAQWSGTKQLRAVVPVDGFPFFVPRAGVP